MSERGGGTAREAAPRHNEDAFFITFQEAINEDTVKSMIILVKNVVDQVKPSQICILFSSSGGSVNAGITLHNFLRAVPAEIVFHNIGAVDSIATAVFLAGRRRYACANARFLFHGVTYTPPPGEALTQRQLKEFLSVVQQCEAASGKVVTDNTSIGRDEVLALFDQGETKDAAYALEKGIIHGICDAVIPPGSKHHVFVTPK